MNCFLERLGFSPEDRVVILNADDIGLCPATNRAYFDLVERGVFTSGSLMVPCRGFAEAAAFACDHAAAADLGVHLTLTCEWDRNGWGPLSTRDPLSGLLSPDATFWPEKEQLYASMDPESLAREMRTQLEWALDSGIDVTHIDPHMGVTLHPALVSSYILLAQDFQIPAMIPRFSVDAVVARGVPREAALWLIGLLEGLEQNNTLPLIDHYRELSAPPAGDDDDEREACTRLIRTLQPGLTLLVYHPAVSDPDFSARVSPAWAARCAADYRIFAGSRLAEILAENGIHRLTYRALRDQMRAAG